MGRSRDRTYWQPPYTRDPAKAGWSAEDWEEAVLDALRLDTQVMLVTTR